MKIDTKGKTETAKVILTMLGFVSCNNEVQNDRYIYVHNGIIYANDDPNYFADVKKVEVDFDELKMLIKK